MIKNFVFHFMATILLAVVISPLMTIAEESVPSAGPQAAAWWRMDEGRGTTIRNQFGEGAGTIHGATWKRIGGVPTLWFDGKSDYVEAEPSQAAWGSDKGFTLSAWIYAEDTNRPGSIAGWGWWNPFGLWIEHTQLRSQLYHGGGRIIVDSPTGLAAKRWIHVLTTYDGRSIREYIDGRLAKELEPPKHDGWPAHANQKFYIGMGNPTARYQPFLGGIRDVKVWGQGLTPAQAAAEYYAGAKDIALRVIEQHPMEKVFFCPTRKIRLEGDASPWKDVPAIPLGKEHLNNMVSLGIERQEAAELSWTGPDDLSGLAQFAHNENTLFVRLRITDNVHVAYPGEGMWKGDSVQIAFDTLNDKSTNYGPDDYEYGAALVQGEVNTVCWAKAHGCKSGTITARITRENNVTEYVLAIPYDSLTPFDPQNGILGFSFLVNDNDGPNRKGWLQLTSGIGDGKNPSSFASLLWTDQDWGFSLDGDGLGLIPAAEDVVASLTLAATTELGDTPVQMDIKNEARETVFSQSMTKTISPGVTKFSWVIKAGVLPPGTYSLEGTVGDGVFTETKKTRVTIVSKADVLQKLQTRLDKVKQQQAEMMKRAAELESKQKGSGGYTSATAAVVEVFLPTITGTLKKADPEWKEIELVSGQLTELDEIVSRTPATLIVPEYVSGTAGVRGTSILGTVRIGDQVIENRPVIFQGFNLYLRQYHQLGLLRRCGFNLVQTEIGISSVFPQDNTPTEGYVAAIRQFLDKAGELGVAVDILLAPHYYPEWMARKYPKLMERGWYYSDAPENRELLKQYIDYVVPRLKDSEGLFSICLANEPGIIESWVRACPESLVKWRAWLARQHGGVENLNVVYGTKYASFNDVPPPAAMNENNAAWQDWSWFLQENFADWHGFLADGVHGVDPSIPVHTKFLIDWILLEPDKHVVRLPELLSRVTDMNGHDEWGTIWSSFCSDLQTSVADKPVFNSENHLIQDHYEGYIAPNSISLSLWQQVLHGLCASAMWAWDEYNPQDPSGTSCFTGNILSRPACLTTAANAAMDMMRLSPEITQLQNQSADILLLWSPSDITLQPAITSLILKVYDAAHLLGRRVGFVTEQQLENGVDIPGTMLIVPGTVHLSDQAFAQLKHRCEKKPFDLILVGDACLSINEYGQARSDTLPPALKLKADMATRVMWEQLYSRYPPAIRLLEEGLPAWNIEYRSAKTEQGLLVILLNHENRARTIQIDAGGETSPWMDRLREQTAENPVELEAQGVRLLQRNETITPANSQEK